MLVGYENLGLCVNTVKIDDKYSCNKRESFPEPIQIDLSKKPKTFLVIFVSSFEIYRKF